MNKGLKIKIFLLYLFLGLFSTNGFPLPENVGLHEGKKKIEEQSLSEKIKQDVNLKLNLERLINLILKQNLDVKKALLDYKSSKNELLRYQGRFDSVFFLNPVYSVIENSSDDPSSSFRGTETREYNVDVGLSRQFRTGTGLQISINSKYQNIMGANMGLLDLGGKGYQSGLLFSISQEILKNTFGISHRLNEKITKNRGRMQKRVVKMYLANLLVEALIGYWTVLVAEDNLKTIKVSLESTIKIKKLIKKKLSLGLSEKEELLDWNSKVLQSRNAFTAAKKKLFDARQAIIRTLNLDEGTTFDLEKIFITMPSKITFEHALKDAFLKRIDLANQRTLLENSKIEREIAFHNMEPSLKLDLSVGTADYSDEGYSKTFNDLNRKWSLGFELSYPFGNKEAEAKMSNSVINFKKNYIELKRLERVIRDEVESRVMHCDVMYSIYQKIQKSREYSKRYYEQVFRKFKQGRYNALQLKLALDGYINMSLQELKGLVDYNISILKRDLSRNVIFEKYGINVDSILNN